MGTTFHKNRQTGQLPQGKGVMGTDKENKYLQTDSPAFT